MKISGYKTRSVLERYTIINEWHLRLAAQCQDEYFQNSAGTIVDFKEKGANQCGG